MSRPSTSRGKSRISLRAVATAASFCLFPFAGFLADNRAESVDFRAAAPYVVGLLAIGVLASVIAGVFRGSTASERAAVIVAGSSLAFFNYNNLQTALTAIGRGTTFWERILVWLVVSTAVVAASVIGSRRRALWKYVLAAGLVLFLVPIAVYLGSLRETWSNPVQSSALAPGHGQTAQKSPRLPNVYFFLPDGYGRSDQLKRVLSFDNRPFLEALKARGFHVAGNARSNYTVTWLSLPSMLDTSYVIRETQKRPAKNQFFHLIAGDNRFVRALRAHGYRYIVAPPGGWEERECAGLEDLCIEPLEVAGTVQALTETEWTFLQLTPFSDLIREFFSHSVSRPYAEPQHVVRTIRTKRVEPPYFVMTHLLQPHPPHYFAENCELQSRIDPSLTWWGLDSDPVEKGLYLGSLQCVNRRLLKAVDEIVEFDPAAIVLIQSDHGTLFNINWKKPVAEWTNGEIEERLGILSALRLPPHCEAGGEDRSAVNSLRYVVACIEGREPDPLPSEHFIMSSRPGGIRKVQ